MSGIGGRIGPRGKPKVTDVKIVGETDTQRAASVGDQRRRYGPAGAVYGAVHKTAEIPQLLFIMVVVIPVITQRQIPIGPCDQEIPLLLDTVIDIPVVQVVQLPGLWSRRAENCGFPQLQFLSRRSHARCCTRQALLVPQLPFIAGRRLLVFPQRWPMSLLCGPTSRCTGPASSSVAAVG